MPGLNLAGEESLSAEAAVAALRATHSKSVNNLHSLEDPSIEIALIRQLAAKVV
jgi:hypothetical protein